MFMTPIQKTNGEGGVSESPLTYTTARHMSPAPNVEFKANVNFKDAGRRRGVDERSHALPWQVIDI